MQCPAQKKMKCAAVKFQMLFQLQCTTRCSHAWHLDKPRTSPKASQTRQQQIPKHTFNPGNQKIAMIADTNFEFGDSSQKDDTHSWVNQYTIAVFILYRDLSL